jgi:hypothetical protein
MVIFDQGGGKLPHPNKTYRFLLFGVFAVNLVLTPYQARNQPLKPVIPQQAEMRSFAGSGGL